ncbi:MAG TPA: hypothetical protein VN495_01370 [Candidatus Paceibacterota bacterium]|nr:hypothetical protein [Candidatus Paceibacterota bacterium]
MLITALYVGKDECLKERRRYMQYVAREKVNPKLVVRLHMAPKLPDALDYLGKLPVDLVILGFGLAPQIQDRHSRCESLAVGVAMNWGHPFVRLEGGIYCRESFKRHGVPIATGLFKQIFADILSRQRKIAS